MYYAKGSPKNPFSDEEVNEKFRSLALPIMEKSGVDQMIQMISNLESVKDLQEITRLLS